MLIIDKKEHILRLTIPYNLKQSQQDLEHVIEHLNDKYGSSCYRITRSGIDPQAPPNVGKLVVEISSDIVIVDIEDLT